jgi:hypothetical protein
MITAVWEWQLGRIRARRKVRKGGGGRWMCEAYCEYSVRDPCSHRERYIRAAQMDLSDELSNVCSE